MTKSWLGSEEIYVISKSGTLQAAMKLQHSPFMSP